MMLSMLEPLVLNTAEPEEPGVYLYQTLCVLGAWPEVQASDGTGSPISVVAFPDCWVSVNGTVLTVMAFAKLSLGGGGPCT